ncbi:TnsA endonuclease N-terminal domain-containing protein [Laribacter hongkongensis]|uniref:TnsA endonuclease N-terminal domain-containing protein n=1 Tax=Laribacter hongkongensis TaxID=168471 RepID=UPI001EFE5702|nr:TnsA endonuclease N-terminal domain-containing protein [Laribacter hongkongensis]MCG9065769.1 TnsA endonuclease N-terminal domain-containing protein [Laribacter hongkongensis]
MSITMWQGQWQGKAPSGNAHQRAREILKPTGGIVRGKFPSRKNGRMVQHEGLLELDAIYLFETHPGIVAYREQPLTLRYPDGPRLRRYTPDFELVLAGGEVVLVEIKPTRSLADDEVRHKLDCVEQHLRREGRQFVVLSDQHLRREPRLSNLRELYHRTPRIPPMLAAARHAIQRIAVVLPLTLGDARRVLAATGVDPVSLLLLGLLTCELDTPLAPETLLQLNEKAGDGWFRITQTHGF